MTKKINIRALCANTCLQIIDQGQSLDRALAQKIEHHQLSASERGFLQELVYGVVRWYWQLDDIAGQLLNSPIRKKDRVVHFLLLTGLYQLIHLNTAQHAAVSETVGACKQLKKEWAKNLINGCLRQFLRKPLVPTNHSSHPDWLNNRVSQSWPEYSERIIEANNQRPPFCLRVNRHKVTREAYLSKLIDNDIEATTDPYSADGIIITKPVPVGTLPGFFSGQVSVQDTAAQLACDLLKPEEGHSILDACAAPGGKTAHILEYTGNNSNLLALDISEQRCEQLHDTLQRLDLNANIQAADATALETWRQPNQCFDRILIDAPCSGLGVIRRHPDIKHHRQPSDIEQLLTIQQQLLVSLWQTLKPSGHLLYMTCSILPEENEQQIATFIKHQHDAHIMPIKHPNALAVSHGVQTLPGVHNMDGFYYCLLEKNA